MSSDANPNSTPVPPPKPEGLSNAEDPEITPEDEEEGEDFTWDSFHEALADLEKKWFKDAAIANMYLISEIHDAAAKGKVDILMDCIEKKGQDVDELDQADNTPLHWAAGSGKDAAIQYLLSKGAHINARNKLGDTALHRAVWRGHLSTVQLLLDNEVDVGVINHQGMLAVDLARDPAVGELVQSYEAPDSDIEGHYIMEGYSDPDEPGAGTDDSGSDTD